MGRRKIITNLEEALAWMRGQGPAVVVHSHDADGNVVSDRLTFDEYARRRIEVAGEDAEPATPPAEETPR